MCGSRLRNELKPILNGGSSPSCLRLMIFTFSLKGLLYQAFFIEWTYVEVKEKKKKKACRGRCIDKPTATQLPLETYFPISPRKR